jgi:MFS family permease
VTGDEAAAAPAAVLKVDRSGTGWRGIALICLSILAPAANYTNHGPLIPLLSADLGVSPAQAGLLSTMFFGPMLLTMLPSGPWIDRYGGKRVTVLCYSLIVAGTLGMGLGAGLTELFVARAVAGIGAGICFLAGISYTRAMAPPGRRLLAQGLYGGVYLLSSGLTVYAMPALADPFGWRGAFVVTGAVFAGVWLIYALLAPPDAGLPSPGGLLPALRNRNALILSCVHMAGFGLAMVVATWAAVYLVHDYGLPLQAASLLGSLVLLGGIVWRPLGGVLVDRRVVGSRRLIRVSLAIALGALGWLAAPSPGLAWGIAGLLLVGLATGLPYAAVFNGAAAAVPDSPASAQALVGWAGAILVLAAPPLIGGLLEATDSFAAGYLTLALFVLATLASTRWLDFPERSNRL